MHGRVKGFEFGSRRTTTLCARIYDKLADIDAKGSDRWFALWGDRRLEGTPVARIEFEFSRQRLRQFGVSTPAEVLGGIGDLWSYATGEWLSLRTPTGDTNRSRWPLSPEWEATRRAELFGARLGLERIRAGRTAGSLRRLVPAITGHLVGAPVVLGTDALEETVDALLPHVRRFERITRRPFANRVAERWVETQR